MTDGKATDTVETLREWIRAAYSHPDSVNVLEVLSMTNNVVDTLDGVLKRLGRLEERLDAKEASD